MSEFIEKLIGRLEEEKETSFAKYRESFELYVEEFWRGRMGGFAKAIVIVNQLAEEYKDKTMINEQYCWQTCGATEHCKECNRLCNGNIDYYENYDVLSEEYGKDTNIPTIDAGELLGNSEQVKQNSRKEQ